LLGERVWVFGRVEFVGKGREAAEADVEDYTQAPDVDGAGVAAAIRLLEDFGCDVGWCATESRCEGFLADDLCETEVR